MTVPEYERFPRSTGERVAQQAASVDRRIRKLERNPQLYELQVVTYEINNRSQSARTIVDRGGVMYGGTSSASYSLMGTANQTNGGMILNSGSLGQVMGPQNPAFYFDPADYDEPGMDTYFQLRASVYSNALASPGRTFYVVLMTVTAAGTGPAITLTGTGPSGGSLANPGTSGEVTMKHTFSLGGVGAGHRVIGVAPVGGATAANSTCLFNARLEYFHLLTP